MSSSRSRIAAGLLLLSTAGCFYCPPAMYPPAMYDPCAGYGYGYGYGYGGYPTGYYPDSTPALDTPYSPPSQGGFFDPWLSFYDPWLGPVSGSHGAAPGWGGYGSPVWGYPDSVDPAFPGPMPQGGPAAPGAAVPGQQWQPGQPFPADCPDCWSGAPMTAPGSGFPAPRPTPYPTPVPDGRFSQPMQQSPMPQQGPQMAPSRPMPMPTPMPDEEARYPSHVPPAALMAPVPLPMQETRHSIPWGTRRM